MCCACSSKAEYQQITCDKITSDMIIIDVRSAAEYKFGHLDNAINIDLDNLNSDSLKDISKDSKIVLYCQTGRRSKEAFPHCHGSHAQPPRRAEGRGMRGNVRFSRKAGRNERADLQAGEGVLSRDRHVYLRKAFRNERV